MPNTVPQALHQARPEQAELEREHRAGDRPDRESTAMAFDQRRASRMASASSRWIPRQLAIKVMAGNEIPKLASTMWQASVNAIISRAARMLLALVAANMAVIVPGAARPGPGTVGRRHAGPPGTGASVRDPVWQTWPPSKSSVVLLPGVPMTARTPKSSPPRTPAPASAPCAATRTRSRPSGPGPSPHLAEERDRLARPGVERLPGSDRLGATLGGRVSGIDLTSPAP